MKIKTLALGAYGANCYILCAEGAREGLLIDPGDNAGVILRELEKLGIKLKYILLTHGHPDHCGALAELKAATGALFGIHPADMDLLNNRLIRMLLGMKTQNPPAPDLLLGDGDIVSTPGLELKVLATPGHSPGGISLLGEGVLFTGDSLFNQGIGRTDLPGGDSAELLRSINQVMMSLPDETIIYPGHGSASTIGAERRGNPFL
jgi:glyoxylase-like metal-dependent hydrolase (beta-lactamase superfamily II)